MHSDLVLAQSVYFMFGHARSNRNSSEDSTLTDQSRPFGMIYDGYLRTVADRFEQLFRQISATYNFDLGPEFEIALCKALRVVLPQRFGICRGFVVTADGQSAGDDIIIFQRDRFGTLRLLEQDRFEQKEKIPLETVCAYIEAKHTLTIHGEGAQSLSKALTQVAKVSALPREQVPLTQITHHVHFPTPISRPPDWPQYHNPLYRVIWARQVRIDGQSPPTDDKDSIHAAFREASISDGVDLVVAGPDFICIPVVKHVPSEAFSKVTSPFLVPGVSTLGRSYVPGLGYAVGVLELLWALDTMQMGRMPWHRLVGDAFEHYQESQ
jgi:hypothetical protein